MLRRREETHIRANAFTGLRLTDESIARARISEAAQQHEAPETAQHEQFSSRLRADEDLFRWRLLVGAYQ